MYVKHIEHLRSLPRVPRGHAHFRQRAAMSRRQFLKAGAATAAALAFGPKLWSPRIARAGPPVGGAPNPIPGGTEIPPFGFFHLYLPTDAFFPTEDIQSGEGDPSSITDFNGTVGVIEALGGTGRSGEGVTQYWAADLRFMDGLYIDVDGHHRQGTFALI